MARLFYEVIQIADGFNEVLRVFYTGKSLIQIYRLFKRVWEMILEVARTTFISIIERQYPIHENLYSPTKGVNVFLSF